MVIPAERDCVGSGGRWDVDDYEHLVIREPRMRDLWRSTMEIGGLPEEWPRLDEGTKNQLREIIRAIRRLAEDRT